MLFNFKLFSRVYYFLLLLILITAGGTIGFVIIEDWSFIDSIYMTVITISTVGFGEVNELSSYGKLFTAFLIMSSFGIFAYAVTSITTYLVGGEYKRYFKEYKSMKESSKLKNHVIICGYGRVGKQVAKDLLSHNDEFIVIEANDEAIFEESNHKDVLFLKGDSTHDDILFNATEYREIVHFVTNKIPFTIADQYNDADKPMMGKLIEKFGNEYEIIAIRRNRHEQFISLWKHIIDVVDMGYSSELTDIFKKIKLG